MSQLLPAERLSFSEEAMALMLEMTVVGKELMTEVL